MATFQGISQVAFYDKNAGSNDLASVLFSKLDASKSKIDLNAPAKGERDITGGMVYSGEMFRMMIEGADDAKSTKLGRLRQWLVANKRVSAIALSGDGTVAYSWLEADRLMEARPVPVMGEMKGRADFVRTGLERVAHDPQIYAQRNIVSHLAALDLVSTASEAAVRTFFLPIPDVDLYVSCKAEEVSGQTFNAAGNLTLEFLDVAGMRIGSAVTRAYTEGRVELPDVTTPAMVHSVRITAAVPNATFTVSELSVRLDGSYDYIAR